MENILLPAQRLAVLLPKEEDDQLQSSDELHTCSEEMRFPDPLDLGSSKFGQHFSPNFPESKYRIYLELSVPDYIYIIAVRPYKEYLTKHTTYIVQVLTVPGSFCFRYQF